jgi:hypothetical protein
MKLVSEWFAKLSLSRQDFLLPTSPCWQPAIRSSSKPLTLHHRPYTLHPKSQTVLVTRDKVIALPLPHSLPPSALRPSSLLPSLSLPLYTP